MLKIYVENQVFEYQNKKENVGDILETIENTIDVALQTLYFMKIDDEEIYGDYENYFLNHLSTIENVQVNLISYKKLVVDTIRMGHEYLKGAPVLIETLAENFYKNPDEQAWNTLADLLEGIDWSLKMHHTIKFEPRLEIIVKDKNNWTKYTEEIDELNEVIPEFEEAVLNRDTVMIADILSYEISPKFSSMAINLQALTDEENY